MRSSSRDTRAVSAVIASAGARFGRNDSAAGNSVYSSAGVDSMVRSHSPSVARPPSVIRYVVRSGRLSARSVDATSTRPSRTSRWMVW